MKGIVSKQPINAMIEAGSALAIDEALSIPPRFTGPYSSLIGKCDYISCSEISNIGLHGYCVEVESLYDFSVMCSVIRIRSLLPTM